MGTFKGVPLWILLVILSLLNVLQAYDETQQTDVMMNGPSRISFIQATSPTPVIKAINTAHNSKICSTWGNFHFKNFDGDLFYFPGTCNYVFSSHCKSAYESFNIQIRRTVVNNVATIDKINMKMEGLVVQLDHNNVMVDDKSVQLPFSGSGVQIDKNGVYLKVNSKLGLVFMWNDDDSLLLELDEKYANQTCGLCGDYNGISINNEFISNGIQITETQFGNLQKLDGPTEQCQEVLSTPRNNCTDYENICEGILMMAAFSNCHSLVGVGKYIEACVQDLCRCDGEATAICLCNTFAEYSRQCAHAGGEPQNWRSSNLCPKTCPYNMKYQECGSPCADTCSNPERSLLCENHCLEGCFCPSGTVFDDINNSGCVPVDMCSCTFNGKTYAAGTSYSTECSTCMCSRGKWNCQNVPCPSTCSVEGGSHITTYDQTRYTIHGDCNYVLSKVCSGTGFTILAELRKCGLSESETCLKSSTIILNGGETIIVIKPCGSVYVNNIYTQLPVSAANVTIFRPSSFYIIVESKLGVQVVAQLIPFMQVYLILDPSFKTKTCGLCGNFNDKQSDDFQTISGVIEGTAASFANTWKTRADCPNVKNVYEDPCSLSVENEKFAKYWCGLIADLSGPFAECHSTVNPIIYKQTCMFDTCNCEKSEDCMCAALSSYVRACAAKGVMLSGWRSTVCSKYMNTCPKTLNYTYSITTCQSTCRSLSEPDATCGIKFFPVDGCTCTEGYYMDDSGKCVPAAACPCYYKGSAVPSGEVVHDNGVMCTCTQGQLSCIGSTELECKSPMVFFDCKNASVDARGAECQKSCQTLDMECYRTKCVSGCVCPEGLVADGKGGCIAEDQCPCIHNDVAYQPGEQIKMKCNTCTCKDRMWQCTNEPCLGTCAVYGDGHYITFDGKRYSFNGDCEYVLAQDHCGQVGSDSTFRVITENVPCGTTGTTCSKAIKVFLNNYEMILTEEHIDVLERGIGGEVPYTIRRMGIYLIIEADNGLILMWDQRTSIFIKLSKEFEGKVCGLCGNFDGDGNNDFTTRSMSVVGDVVEFGNSWKLSPMCPNVITERDACSANPYRKAWAQKQCSIINSKAFSACHIQVDPSKYYDACVTDSCACDTGGDCECFCTAVAAYAQACGENGVCVSWRTPSICPMFCDYYNPEGECEWHYKPCGAPCMKTCRNPSGKCLHELSGLEGCYPSCPGDKPFFDEDEMECVVECSYCYDDEGNHYKPGSPVTAKETCQSCECTISGFIECTYNRQACNCEYQGRMYDYNDVIYNTTDGIGGCITAICKENGTVYRDIYPCNTPTTTPFTFTTTPSTGTTTPPITTTPSTTPVTTTEIPTTTFKPTCTWSSWIDVHIPGDGMDEGDFETYENIRAANKQICQKPDGIQCRAENYPETPIGYLGQVVQCDVSVGLVCKNEDQEENVKTCLNYQVKVLCCSSLTTPATSTAETTTIPKTTTTTKTTSSLTTALDTATTTPIPGTSTSTTTTTPVISCGCQWSNWFDVSYPKVGTENGDFEIFDTIRARGYSICNQPTKIECRAKGLPDTPLHELGQNVQCNASFGLLCYNKDQVPPICYNYEIRVCCSSGTCTSTSARPTEPTTEKEIITTTQTPTTTPKITAETTTTTTTVPPTTRTTTTTTTTQTTTITTRVPPPPTTTTTTLTTTAPTTTKVSTITPYIIPETTTTTKTPIPPTSTPKTIPEYTSTTATAPPTTTSTTATSTKTTTTTSERTTTTSPTTTKEVITTTKPPIPPTSTPKTITEYTSTTTTAPPTTTSTTTTTTKTTTPTSERTTTTTRIPPTPATTTSTTPETTTTTAPTTTKIPTITPKIIPEPTTTTSPTTTKEVLTTTKPPVPPTSTPTTTTAPPTTTSTTTTTTKTTTPTSERTTTTTRIPPPPTTTTSTTPETTTPPTTTKISTITPKIIPETTTTTTTTTTSPSPTTTKEVITTTKPPVPPTSTPTTTTAPPTTTSTTTTTTKTTTPTSESTTKTTRIPPPPTTPTTTTSTTPITITTTAPTTTKVSTITPSIIPETTTTNTSCGCQWSNWLDASYPTAGIAGGDFDTFDNIRAKGYSVCNQPSKIECRAKQYPDTPLQELGQNVQCNASFGLLCYNKDQFPAICYNYEIRVCCSGATCTTTGTTTTSPTTTKEVTTTTPPTSTPKTITEYTSTTTTAPPTTTSTNTTTTKTTTPTSESTTTTTRIPPPPTTPTTTTSTTPITITTTAPTTTKVSTITPSIIPETTTKTPITTTTNTSCGCQWSNWLDASYPTSGISGGDFDTFDNIRAKGYSVCNQPSKIECRAKQYPDTPLQELGQNVQCNASFGLLCYNKDQFPAICYNYEIRVCCSGATCTTTGTTTTSPTNTKEVTTTTPPTSTPKTITEYTSTTTTAPPTTTSTNTTTTKTTTPTSESTTTTTRIPPPPTTPTTTTSTTPITITTTAPTTTKVSTITPSIIPETTTKTPITTTTNTSCGCQWSNWLDASYPTSGISGGDFDTFDNIRAKGYSVCNQPSKIECRAKQYPDTPLQELGQNVQCNASFGLLCYNKDQFPAICYNYEIRVCCSRATCTTTGTTTTSPTTTKEVTTTTKTPIPPTSTPTTITEYTSTTTTSPPTTTSTTTTTTKTTTPTSERTTTTTRIPPPPTPTTTTSTTPATTTTTAPTTTKISTITPKIITETTTTTTTTSPTTTKEVITTTKPPIPPTSTPTTTTEPPTTTSTTTTTTKTTTPTSERTTTTTRIPPPPTTPTTTTSTTPITITTTAPATTKVSTITPSIIPETITTTTSPTTTKEVITTTKPPIPPTSTPTTTTAPPTTTSTTTTTTKTTTPTSERTTTTTRIPPPPTTPTTTTSTTPITITTTAPTTTKVSTITPSIIPETTTPITTTTNTSCGCQWSNWLDASYPTSGISGGDFDTFDNIRAKGYSVCNQPSKIECRAKQYPDTPLQELGQNVQCNASFGLLCYNKDQFPAICYNYEIRVCCSRATCTTTGTTTTSPTTTKEVTTTTPPTSTPKTITAYTSTTTTAPPTTTSTNTTTTKTTTPTSESTTTTTRIPPPPTTPTTTTTTTTTTSTTPITIITTSTITKELTTTEHLTTKEATQFTTAITTRCYCRMDGEFFLTGAVIYNRTDEAGCHFYAICNEECNAERFQGPCQPTTLPPPTTTTTPVSTTTTSIKTTTPTTETTTPVEGCPPRKTNETWSISNCTVAKCHGNNVVTFEPVSCPPVEIVTCDNGFPPVKVYSADGCCYHYECECICGGWGDPHYITFDGTYYTFLDNCTYVLVQQITPKFDNFRVLVDNYFCDAADGLSCPQSLIIYYKSNELLLTRTMFQGRMRNMIRFNQNWVTPGFTADGIIVSSAGINMVVEIPEIKAYISFSGLIFVIKLPFSMFGYNTEGQCGTCSNNSTEDCRLPDGKVIEDCSQMAGEWRANFTVCNPPPEPTPTPSVPPTDCPSTPLCDVILSDVFAVCHEKISPEPYYKGCIYDACRIRTDSVQCSSLEVYAAMCASIDVCVDWRGNTEDHCPYYCPAGKVYNPCGPVHCDTCENREVPSLSTGMTEGCYCPSGTKLFNTYADVCVKSCPCVGPDGMPKAPAEKWISNCQECVCEATTLTVQCSPINCVQIQCAEGFEYKEVKDQCCGICEPVACTMKMNDDTTLVIKPGETWNSPVDKCSYYQCNKTDEQFVTVSITKECTVSSADECRPGYTYRKVESECCGTCVQEACTMMMKDNSTKVLQPEETWTPPNEPCLYYECHKIGDQFVPTTVTRVCSIMECSAGYTYIKVDSECCGTCKQEECTMKMKDNSTKVLKPGEKYTPPDEKCISYICTDTHDVVTEKDKCGVADEAGCSEGYNYTKSEDECCGKCVQVACTMKMKDDSIKVLKPGEKYIPVDEKCTSYNCTETYDLITEKERCLVVSPTNCSEGYNYTKAEGDCCGKCEPVACTMKMSDNSTKVIKPEETWTPPNEPCLYYECHKIDGQFVPVNVMSVCSVLECSAGYMYKKAEGDCCGSCEMVACTMKMDNNTIITLMPGEKYTPPDQKCTSYTCNSTYHVVTEKENCNVSSAADCSGDFEYRVMPGKCCGECVKVACTMKMDNNTTITLKSNETWSISNCTVAKCHENDVVTIEPVTCKSVEEITCASGFPPVKVYDSDGCCYHYECECVCSGWGDPHYITFDGTYYTFLDNCTYVLVQQITPKFDNFRVLIDNYFCDAADGLSCPQSLLIYYKSNEVLLTRTMFEGRMRNRIRFNQIWVTPGFTTDGITVSSAGINMVVEIPEIKAYISFSGLIFVIKLPFSMFGYNTEGQCGTCSNNSTEDCRLPDGKVIEDCSEMATQWRANVSFCNPPPEPTPTPSVPPTECPPSPLCDVILSDVFAECHEKISPEPYHEGCVFDACRIRNDSVQCSSLEIYAALCASIDVCVDWRAKTGDHCPYNCPAGKMYDACGAVHADTCDNRQIPILSNGMTEGCYCPSGTKLFNSYTDVCVESCSCVGPDGMPKASGEKWTSNCQECFCEATSLTVQCTPLKCDQIKCAEGFQFKEVQDQCCGGICEPVACTMKMNDDTTIVIKPGETWNSPVDKCSYYQCNKTDEQFVTMSITKECTVSSADECRPGYKYSKVEGECCGTCDPVACTMMMNDSSTKVLEPEETWTPPNEPCLYYECHKIGDQFVPITVTRVCAIAECSDGSNYTRAEGECCGTCVPVACTMKMKDNSTKVLKPGEKYTPADEKCVSYICTDTYDVITEKEKCPVISPAGCSEGYTYKEVEGNCCGACVPEACTMKMKDNSTKVLKPGEKYTPSDEKCTSYICTEIYNVVTEIEKCLVVSPANCSEGYKYAKSEGECCGTCVPEACTMKMKDDSIKVLKPGEKYTPPDEKCVSYICTDTYDVVTEREKCIVVSPTDCSEGYQYKKDELTCCGTCEQVACTMKMKDNSTNILKPEETWTPPNEPCLYYECHKIEDQFVPVTVTRVCSVVECSAGYMFTKLESECCGLCVPSGCTMKMDNNTIITLKPGEKYTPLDQNCVSYTCNDSYHVVTEKENCPVIDPAGCLEGFEYKVIPGKCCGECVKEVCTVKMDDNTSINLKTNETWSISNCTVAKCHGNDVVTIEPVTCPPVETISCENGFPPVKVYNSDGCCYHYQCECVCSGWGDPHYVTFDGTYYTFLDNCTYVLVQQITPKFDNFRVLIDNYFCDAADGLSCPQSLLIYYKSNEVLLTRTMFEGRMRNRIRFNQHWVTPGFTIDGITVSSSGINMVVEIPEINAYISFSGLIFVIKLPFTLFGYNTEGQCGTCSNNSTEDCRLPGGEVVADCSEMATQWRANVSYCNPPPEPTPTPSVPPTECPPAPVCDVILSDVFAECHEKISPEPYYEGCVFDACRISNYSVQCSSLEVYAALCASIDVCVDWRGKSAGHCSYNCPTGKVYNACGPVCQNTCENRQVPSLSNKVIEGCYCPSDTTLFNTYSDVCVKSCACVGPDGMPREPSEKWTSNCQECFCEATSLTVQCTPLNCDQVKCAEGFQFKEMKDQCCGGTCEAVACTMKMNDETTIVIQPGETWNSPVDKCSYYQCNKTDAQFVILSITKECTVSSADECKPGYTYKYVEGECCGTCVQEACTMKMKDDSIKDLKPGEKYTPPDEKCVSYICTDTYDVVTEREKCLVASPTDCSEGSKYTKAESDCCGSCVAEACTMAMKDNSTKVLQPGERYTLPEEKCTSYICTNTYDVITEREKCLVLSAADCSEGYKYTKAESDCCGSCEHVACTMKMKDESIKVLQPGEKYTPVDEKCISYICTETYTVVTEREKCLVASPSDCSEGYTYSTSVADCCGKCVQVACTMKMQDNSIKVLKPGEKYTPADQKCTSYICTDTYDLVTEKEKCLVVSPADCTEGFNYTKSESDCCGSCVQAACTMKMSDNSIKVLKPGEKYTPADEKCTSYICTETYDLVTEKERCLVVSPSDCSEGYKYTQSEGECCGLCEPVACTMKMKDSSIKVLQPGEKYTPADEKCTSYICTETYTVVTEIDRCLVITAADCLAGYKYTKAEGDCCGACEPVACTMKMKDNSTKVLQPGEKYTPADEKCTSYICTNTYDLVTEKEKCLVISPADCSEGFTYSTSEADCCGRCVPVACTMKMQDNSVKVLKPGEKYTPADQKCTSYICTDTYDLVTEKEKCLVISPADCTEGFNYTKSESDCCGSCVQEACTMKMSDNSIKVLKPGEKYTPVDEKCTSYICTETYDLVTEKERCLVMSPSDCSEGYKYTQSEGKCCGLCEPVACTMKMKDSSIKVLQPGEKYTPADEKCTSYICTETYTVVTEIEKCLVVSPTDCSAGYKYTKAEGDCCGSCEPVACTMKMKDESIKVLQPGEKYTPADEKCTSYICTNTYDLVTEKEKCLVISPADCSEGYTYKQAESECCGSCEPVACTMKMKDNSTKVLQPGEKYTPPDEKCTSYICTDAYDVITERETCPAFNLADCLEGTIKMSENGCCKTCEPIVSSCQVHKQSTRIITGTCESDQTVELSYCEGGCKTTSMYSAEANTMEHKCSCCQEMKTSKREVSLKCLDGTSSLYSYIYVEECGCTSTECDKDPQTSNGLK